jgi:hypothetical protein
MVCNILVQFWQAKCIPNNHLNFIGICCDSLFFISNFINLGLFAPSFG